ncbi:hypothetical protein OC835_006522, partial [Tilletia horrida]
RLIRRPDLAFKSLPPSPHKRELLEDHDAHRPTHSTTTWRAWTQVCFRMAALPLPFAAQQNEPTTLRLSIAKNGAIALWILAACANSLLRPLHRAHRVRTAHTRSESNTAAVLAVSPPQRVLLLQERPTAFLDGQALMVAARGATANALAVGSRRQLVASAFIYEYIALRLDHVSRVGGQGK